MVGEPQRHQFLVALQQIRHAARGNGQPAPDERLVDLGHAAMLGEPQPPSQGDDVQTELAVRQRPVPLFLWAVGPVVEETGGVLAAAHRQVKAIEPVERGDGAPTMVGNMGRVSTVQTVCLVRLQRILAWGAGARLATGHMTPPAPTNAVGGPQYRPPQPGLPA